MFVIALRSNSTIHSQEKKAQPLMVRHSKSKTMHYCHDDSHHPELFLPITRQKKYQCEVTQALPQLYNIDAR
jgi:hypothetical protein